MPSANSWKTPSSKWNSKFSSSKHEIRPSIKIWLRIPPSSKNNIISRSLNFKTKLFNFKHSYKRKTCLPPNCTRNTLRPRSNLPKPAVNYSRNWPNNHVNSRSKKQYMNKRSLSYKCSTNNSNRPKQTTSNFTSHRLTSWRGLIRRLVKDLENRKCGKWRDRWWTSLEQCKRCW